MPKLIIPNLLFCLLCLPSFASAQPGYPVYPGPYGGGYNPGRYGGMLYGTADVMRAQSESWTEAEKARILGEQANQAKLDTRKKAFDQAAYEKKNTPSSLEKDLAYDFKSYQRVLLKPTPYDLSSGRAFNMMLPQLDRMAREGTYGPPPALDPALLKAINTTSPGQTGFVMLADVQSIPWPIGVLGKSQEKLADSLEKAIESIREKGRLDVKSYTACQTEFKNLRAQLDKDFDQEKINMSRFAEGSTFLSALNKEIVALGNPAAAKALARPNHPQGNDVLEVVGFMIGNGLEFAPCKPGDEAAYKALHTAMAAFAQSSQVASALTADPTLRVINPTKPKK